MEYLKQAEPLRADKEQLFSRYQQLLSTAPTPETYQINCEDCSGDQLLNCSRCEHCFTLKDSQDCMYCGTGESDLDCLDSNFCDSSELQYYSTNLQSNYRVIFSALVWYTNHGTYLTNCFNGSNLFGCTGMKRNSFCILNKQYSEDEYHKLTYRLVEHMKETKEWGQFFPIRFSPFAFNKSSAYEYYPLTQEEANKRGWPWEDEQDTPHAGPADEQLCRCEISGKAFRITPQEVSLLKRLNLAVPSKSPQVRHLERMAGIKRAISDFC